MRVRQLDRLDQRSITSDIPRCEADPLLARRVEGNLEMALAKACRVGRRDDLKIGTLSIAPDDLDEVEWERPFHVRDDLLLVPGALDAVRRDQNFARRYEVIAALQDLDD